MIFVCWFLPHHNKWAGDFLSREELACQFRGNFNIWVNGVWYSRDFPQMKCPVAPDIRWMWDDGRYEAIEEVGFNDG